MFQAAFVLPVVIVLVTWLGPSVCLAGTGAIETGRKLVEINCARCHAIGREGNSPLAKAPPFREVVMRYDPAQLEEALGEGIVTGHNEMPQFEFGPDELAAIVAYLDSLRDE